MVCVYSLLSVTTLCVGSVQTNPVPKPMMLPFNIVLESGTQVILAKDAEDAAWAGMALAERDNTFLIDVQPIDETN